MFHDLLWHIFYKRVEIKPEDVIKSIAKDLAEIESEVSKADRFIDWLLKIKILRWAIKILE